MKKKNAIRLALLGCLGLFLLAYFALCSKTETLYPIPYERDAAQHEQRGEFIEWWYFDGHINDNLSFALTYWTSSGGDWSELTLYDSLRDKRVVYREEYPQNSVTVSGKKCGIRMGPGGASENNGVYSILFESKDCRLRFKLTPSLPGFENQTTFPRLGFSFRPWTVAVPRGRISGTLETQEGRIDFDGTGYHDHNYIPFPKLFALFKRGWYWGRFFTKNYTIVMCTVDLKHKGHSYFYVFKNREMVRAATGPNILSAADHKMIARDRIPEAIDITFDSGSLSILNESLSRRTPWYTRYVNKVKLTISDGNNPSVEEGTGLSEVVR